MNMIFSLQPEQRNTAESIDYEAIAKQVDEGTNLARVSLIVDLGIQEGGIGFDIEQETECNTEQEAQALVSAIQDIGGEGADKVDYTQQGDVFVVNAATFKKKDAQEVAIFCDLPDVEVEYVKGKPKLPYRVLLNPTFKAEMKGMRLIAAKPAKGSKLWTFASNSMLSKLAVATKHPEIISEGKDNMNIGKILGEPLLINIVKKSNFINAKGVMPLMKGQSVPELPFDPVGISFKTVTVEDLKAAKLRKIVIDKIKQAKNYAGSKMEAAILALEASGSDETSDSADDLDDSLPF